MKDKKMETMLDELSEALQRHIATSELCKNFVMSCEDGVAYLEVEVQSQGGEIEVETVLAQSQSEAMTCEIFLDGNSVSTSNSPIDIVNLPLPKGKRTIQVCAGANIVAGKVRISGIISKINNSTLSSKKGEKNVVE